MRKRNYTVGTIILTVLCAAEVAVIILSTTGSIGRRTNGIVDITMLMMTLLTYTLSQTGRNHALWNNIQTHAPSVLDLHLTKPEDFFDPIQVGPTMAINSKYALVISRYICTLRHPAPLQINLHCGAPLSEALRDTIQEVLELYYRAEEARIEKKLEQRYRRVMLLVTVSVFAIGLIKQISTFNEEMIVWEIIGNFAAFGLWQIGYTHYERNEAYEELLNLQIARYAKLSFIER